jgi:excisionase family DNA binding protein
MTIGEVAEYLGVAVPTVRDWANEGRIREFRTLGGHRRFRPEDVEALLAAFSEGRSGARRVLVVDDDPATRMLLRANLEADGYEVREATGGGEAIEAVSGERPDLVLLDVMMPAPDGWQVLQRLHEIEGANGTPTPVLMFSAQLADDARQRALDGGAEDFIGKPFRLEALLEKVRVLLR